MCFTYNGELLLDQSKYQEAIESFEEALEIEKQTKPMGMNVLPLINKAMALFHWKQDFKEAEELCRKALISKLPATSACYGSDADALPKLTLTVMSLSLPWLNCYCNKERSQRRSSISSKPLSSPEQRTRL